MRRRRPVYINEAFRPQRVSGQQRYATEISDRLPGEWVRLRPHGLWAKSKALTWLWVQTVLPVRSLGGVLVSMTARAPIWHPRHVVVVHDLFVLEHPEWFSHSYHLTHAPLQRLQMWTARAIVAVSEPVAAQVRAQLPKAKVSVAPNAPSRVFSEAGPDDAALIAARGLSAGGYLVTVGSLEPRKNLARLAEAYSALSPEERARLPLVVIGGGADIFRDTAPDWPAEAVLAGYVTDDELRALYSRAAAVVFVSLAEGFGLPLVEAAVAGTSRLVVSDLEVFRWICGDSATYVDPASVPQIAGALRSMMPDAPHSAPTLDVGRFNWDRSAEVVATAAASLRQGIGRAEQ
jgi:glycosyltransferase involved in cell wall biosynthesis